MHLLQTLAQAVSEFYSRDPTGAGLTVAYLRSEQAWYISVCRYRAAFAEDKEVICSEQHANLDQCVQAVTTAWREITNREIERRIKNAERSKKMNDLLLTPEK